jgi:ribosomal protein L11 methyltransferase
MSFGIGHHQITQMMITFLLKMNCINNKFLDMGTSTGVLSILSYKMGARTVHAVDFDTWCVENTLNNISVNNCNIINVELSSNVPSKGTCDVILANINRNVLIDQIPFYAGSLFNGGVLLMSGFYIDDLLNIQTLSNEYGFKFIRNFMIDD